MVTLAPTAARALTNREISMLLCGMLNGVAVIEPATTTEFREVVDLSRRLLDGPEGGETLRRLCKGQEVASWRVAFGATVGCLMTWCERVDIETALLWVDENLDRMFRNHLN
jgi:hypothetical protein